MKLKHPQTIIFWTEETDGIRRAKNIKHNVKSPERTKIYKDLLLRFDQGKFNSFGYMVYRPGPQEAQFIKLGTPINTII